MTKAIAIRLNQPDSLIKLWLQLHPEEQSVSVYFPKQQPAFFEVATDVLPVPDSAKAFHLTLEELFGWLLE